MAKYLEIDYAKSRLYEYAYTPQEGFEEHKSSNNKITYRKYYNKGVTGEMLNIGIRTNEGNNNRQNLTVALKNDDGIFVLNFPLYDSNGYIDSTFAEPIITKLGNMDKKMVYTIFPYTLSAEDQKKYDEKTEGREVRQSYRDLKSVSIKLGEGTKVKNALLYNGKEETDPNKVPALVWRDHPTKPGSKKPSAASLEAKSDFLIAYLKEAVNGHLAYEAFKKEEQSEPLSGAVEANETVIPQNTSPQPESENPTALEAPSQPLMEAVIDEDDYEDLPF